MVRIYHKNVTKENTPTNQGTEPEQEEKEKEEGHIDQPRKEDQTDQHRKERALVDGSSKKDKFEAPKSSADPSADKVFGEDQVDQNRDKRALIDVSSEKDKVKAPMSYTDPGADEVDDDIPLIKMLKMVKKMSKFSPPVSGILDKESPKGSIRFMTKNSAPSSTVVSCSRGKNEEPEIRGLRETLAVFLSQQRNVTGTSKWKAPRPLRTRQGTPHNIRCMHKGDMYPSLWGRPDWQMDAICALIRHMISHEAERRFTNPHFTRVGMIVNMLTGGNVDSPCIKSDEELEEMWKGSVTFCLCMLSSYTRELYYLYYGGLDPYFFFIP